MPVRETRRVSRLSPLVEHRHITPARAASGALAVRVAQADAEARTFVGHAAVFEERTAIGDPRTWWGWYEELDRGVFDKTLEESSDARFLVDHDTSMIVARQSAGDLQLRTDKVGLLTEADLDLEVSYIRDLARNIEMRRITGMSFGFQVVRDQWSAEEEIVDGKVVDVDVRRILEVRLLEVSAVTFPAYEQTDAGLRSAIEAVRHDRLGQDPPSSSRREDAPAPAVEATRGSEDGETPTDEVTSRRNDEGLFLEAQLVAARYRLK